MVSYRVHRLLPAFPSHQAEPWAISQRGIVVGASVGLSDSRTPTRWPPPRASEIPGSALSGDGTAWGVNDKGRVVGCLGDINRANRTKTCGNPMPTDAFWYDSAAGVLHNLSPLIGSQFQSAASDINEKGVLVGWTGTTEPRAFSYDTATWGALPVYLGLVPGYPVTFATAINNSGQVVGTALDPGSGERRLFLYESGAMLDLGEVSEVWDISDYGVIVGGRHFGGGTKGAAFTYDSRAKAPGFVDLGTLPGCNESWALGINRYGDIVGWADKGLNDSRAFLYANGTMQALDAQIVSPPQLNWTLMQGIAINDEGYIVARGTVQNVTSKGIGPA